MSSVRHWAERRCNFSEQELDTLTDIQMLDHVYESMRERLEAAELQASQARCDCFNCHDGNTPLYCLNCAGEILAKELGEMRSVIAALRSQQQLPDDCCILCGGAGRHMEGCIGVSACVAVQAKLEATENLLEFERAKVKELSAAVLPGLVETLKSPEPRFPCRVCGAEITNRS